MSATWTRDYAHQAAPTARPTLLGRIGEMLRDFSERRTAHAELRALSDRELSDIGLHRSEIDHVFDPAFARAHARRR